MLGLSFAIPRDGVELDLAGLAVAGFDCVYETGADFGAEREAVYEDEDGLGEVEFEEGFEIGRASCRERVLMPV